MFAFLFSTQHYEFFYLRIIVIVCSAMKLMDLLSSWEEGSLFPGETNGSRICALSSSLTCFYCISIPSRL